MTEFSSWPPWLLVTVAALVGYFLVAKVIDFMKRGSVWDEASAPSLPNESGSTPGADHTAEGSQTSIDSMRRYEQEVQRRATPIDRAKADRPSEPTR